MNQTFRLKGTITALSAIALNRPNDNFAGGGFDEELLRLPRMGAKRSSTDAFIPGSTLKGKLRRAAQDRVIALLKSTNSYEQFSLDEHYMLRSGVDTIGYTLEEKSEGLIDGEKELRQLNPLLSLFGRWKLSGHIGVNGIIPNESDCIYIDGTGGKTNEFIRNPELINTLTIDEQEKLRKIFLEQAASSISTREQRAELAELKSILQITRDSAAKEDLRERIVKIEKSIKEHNETKLVKSTIQRPLPGYECFKPNTTFSHTMTLQNVSEDELGLFIETMAEFSRAPVIGSHMSNDCGRIALSYEISTFPDLEDKPVSIGKITIDEDGFTLEDYFADKLLLEARKNFRQSLKQGKYDLKRFTRE